MMVIEELLRDLRERRDELDTVIEGLELMQSGKLRMPPGVRSAEEQAELRKNLPKRKRGKKVNGAAVSAALTCLQCKPARTFDTAIGLAQHMSWRHTGRKGAERSLQPSTLNN